MDNTIKHYPEFGAAADVVFKITKARGIKISVKQGPQIVVSFPKRCSFKKAEEFFKSKIIWVSNSLQRMEKHTQIRKNRATEAKISLSPDQIQDKKHYIILRCRQLAEAHNFKIKKVILRKQKSIWGSCSYENNISINLNLIYLKNELIDYVILHELVHTKVKNHSKRFWDELESILPDYEKLDKELKSFSPTMIL